MDDALAELNAKLHQWDQIVTLVHAHLARQRDPDDRVTMLVPLILAATTAVEPHDIERLRDAMARDADADDPIVLEVMTLVAQLVRALRDRGIGAPRPAGDA